MSATRAVPVHWPNPWPTAVPVPVEELVEAVYGLGGWCEDVTPAGECFQRTAVGILAEWQTNGERLDGYILPHAGGHHSLMVRFGAGEGDYLNILGDTPKVAALLARYTPAVSP